jgi:hypothetical protein
MYFKIHKIFKKVKNICENILLSLIQCELLVSENFRLKLSKFISIYMPFIQVFSILNEF